MNRRDARDHSEARTVATVEAPWDASPAELDDRLLRLAFAELMDRAAEAVFRAGHDLDEVITRRMLRCRDGQGREILVEARWLADADRLRRDILQAAADGDGTLRIVALVVRAEAEERLPGKA